MFEPPRGAGARKHDVLRRLHHDVDLWAATAGRLHLIPLSFVWYRSEVVLATAASSRTVRNVRTCNELRLALGHPRDVVLIEATALTVPAESAAEDMVTAFHMKTGFDPRLEPAPQHFILATPRNIRAWREENELAGRDVMLDGVWTSV